MDFAICNYIDRFMPTLTKIHKVKKQNRTPFIILYIIYYIIMTIKFIFYSLNFLKGIIGIFNAVQV